MLSQREDAGKRDPLTQENARYPFFMDTCIHDIVGYIHEEMCRHRGIRASGFSRAVKMAELFKKTGCNGVEFSLVLFDYFGVFVDFTQHLRFRTLQDVIAYLRVNIAWAGGRRITLEI